MCRTPECLVTYSAIVAEKSFVDCIELCLSVIIIIMLVVYLFSTLRVAGTVLTWISFLFNSFAHRAAHCLY